MIVMMRTAAQAARVAEAGAALGAAQRMVASKIGELKPGTAVDFLGLGLDDVRAVVEPVSVLYSAATDDDAPLETGWVVRGTKFEVEWPADHAPVASHFGARRFAYNWALARVKADMDAKHADPSHVSTSWTLFDLRKAFNDAKDTDAPWWQANSKEAYAAGIADLVRALDNWKASKTGARKGKKVGFPRFKAKHRDHGRLRFTTGAMRLDPDRRHIVLPRIGALRSKENTRCLQRYLSNGRARILSMTLSEQWGRLFVSISYAQRITHAAPAPTKPDERVGVDLGLRTLATCTDTDGVVTVHANPAPLRATLAERRRAGRSLSRRIPGSRGHEQAKATLARLDRRAVNLRREAAHQLTHELAATYGEIVVEDLDIAAMKKSMGRKAFRRSVSDAALGLIRPMLVDKTRRHGSTLVVADRWFASSKIHHGCRCRLVERRKLDKRLQCAVNPTVWVDRDENASANLRDWTDCSSQGLVEALDQHDTAQKLGKDGCPARTPVRSRERACQTRTRKEPRRAQGVQNDQPAHAG